MKISARITLLLVALLGLAGCSSMAQQGSMLSAHDAYEKQDYARCLSKASAAEMFGSKSRAMDAQIMFYKALCLEGLGQKSASVGILGRLVMLYPDTDWAAAAVAKLMSEGALPASAPPSF